MTDTYSALVTQYAHVIGAEIEAARRRRLISERLSGMTFLIVDVASAETVGCGSRIFPDPGNPGVDWYVLARRTADDLPHAALCSMIGVIPSDAEADEVVAQAYLHVLRRPVDDTGRAVYRPRLASGQITRRGLLRSLANSGEAAKKGIRVMVLPETNLWLPTPDKPD